MKKIIIMLMSVVVLGFGMNVQAGDAKAGEAKSANCTGCHGMNGKSMTPTNPSLAGQKEAYLVKATKAYRDGQRKDPMMNAITAGLSDADIADLAAFYASVK
jgi:cytochrome c553